MEFQIINNSANSDCYTPVTGYEICGCCGSRFIGVDELPYLNVGITVASNTTPDTSETDAYWTESIKIGDEYLIIKHRKVDAENVCKDEDEDCEDFYPDEE